MGIDSFPELRKSDRILQLSFPTLEKSSRSSIAACVASRKLTIDDAIAALEVLEKQGPLAPTAVSSMLERLTTDGSSSNNISSEDTSAPAIKTSPRANTATTPTATNAAKPRTTVKRGSANQTETEESKPDARERAQRKESMRRETASDPLPPSTATTTTTAPAAPRKVFEDTPGNRNRSVDTNTDDPNHRIIHNHHDNAKQPLMHYFYGDSAANYDTEVLISPGQVILFTTSMTGERKVRDHCRQLETLLYIKQIPHHVMDIADNVFLKRKAREVHRSATGVTTMPSMPLLCVDNRLVGGYEQVQDLEDGGQLDERLSRLGVPDDYLHRAKPDYFDPTKREANFGLMSPTSGAKRFSAVPAAVTETPTAAEERPEKGVAKEAKVLSPVASAAAVAAAEARKRVEELEAAKKARSQQAAHRAAQQARELAEEKAKAAAGEQAEADREARRRAKIAKRTADASASNFSAMLPPLPAVADAAANGGRFSPIGARRGRTNGGLTSEGNEDDETQRVLHAARVPTYTRETHERYRDLPAWRQALFKESNFVEIHETFLDESGGACAGSTSDSHAGSLSTSAGAHRKHGGGGRQKRRKHDATGATEASPPVVGLTEQQTDSQALASSTTATSSTAWRLLNSTSGTDAVQERVPSVGDVSGARKLSDAASAQTRLAAR